MIKKIAIVGAHGVGKTTLANALSKQFNCPLIPDFAAAAYHQNFRVNEQTTIENQFWMLASQIEYERKQTTGYIADKSILDNIIYSQFLFGDLRALSLIEEIVMSNLNYTDYIYIPIEFGIESDGRSVDIEFQKKIDTNYLELLTKLKIRYSTVNGDITKRIEQATLKI